jgi:hypothetical protein
MIEFIFKNQYTILGGLLCAFIISHFLVKAINHSFEHSRINRRKFRKFLRIVSMLPFVVVVILIALLA